MKFVKSTLYIEGKVILLNIYMCQKGTILDHDFYVVVGKQCRIENAYAGHQHNIFIFTSTNALLLLICFKLVMKSMKLC